MSIVPLSSALREVNCQSCGVFVRCDFVGIRAPSAFFNLCNECRTAYSRSITVPRGVSMNRAALPEVPIPVPCVARVDRLPAISRERQTDLALLGWIHQWITHQLSPSTRRVRANVVFDAASMTDSYLLGMWHQQRGMCSLTGRPMVVPNWRTVGTSYRGRIGHNPSGASIDRIDSSVGYQSGNVQMVCFAANVMKSNRSDADFIEWCRDVVKEAERTDTY